MGRTNAVACDWCGRIVHVDRSYEVRYRRNYWYASWNRFVVCDECYRNMVRPKMEHGKWCEA